MVGGYRDGAWLVELATLLDASVLVEAVAAVFIVQPQPGRNWRDGLIETPGGRDLLLVLDNFEHVLDGVLPLVEAVLASCTGVVILATSREALGIRGERAWPVPSLDLGIHSAASALGPGYALALGAGEKRTAGALMLESHQSPRTDQEMSIYALDQVVSSLMVTPGFHGARLTVADARLL